MRRRARRYRRARRAYRLIVFALALAIVAILAVSLGRGAIEERDKSKHPLMYESLILAVAEEFSLEPAHVAAVMLCESSFRADAVSYAGAVGLMQIIPETGAWIAGKLSDGGEPYEGWLSEPERNARFGCWYIRFLLDRYGGDMRCATAAYHAGQGTVDRWLSSADTSPDGKTLPSIPARETSIYVERVINAYESYSRLYAFEG